MLMEIQKKKLEDILKDARYNIIYSDLSLKIYHLSVS